MACKGIHYLGKMYIAIMKLLLLICLQVPPGPILERKCVCILDAWWEKKILKKIQKKIQKIA